MKVGFVVDGKYRLVRLVGKGGMGSVWEAEHIEIGKKVAIKFLLPEVASDKETVSRFLREARAAAAIGSDHIVNVTDFGYLQNGSPYLIMEYLHGEDLDTVLKRSGRLPLGTAVSIALQMCEALAPAHEMGIVHRDLKPGNLFLTRLGSLDGWVKVLDFGIAKMHTSIRGHSSSDLTSTGATLGTPYYMAPEQFTGARLVDRRADVYSTGVVLYVMITGEKPFKGSTYEDLIIQVATATPIRPGYLVPELDPKVEDVILRSIRKDVSARFSSMDSLAEALRSAIDLQRENSVLLPDTRKSIVVTSGTVPTHSQTLNQGLEEEEDSDYRPTEPNAIPPTISSSSSVVRYQETLATTPKSWGDLPSSEVKKKTGLRFFLPFGIALSLVTIISLFAFFNNGSRDESSGQELDSSEYHNSGVEPRHTASGSPVGPASRNKVGKVAGSIRRTSDAMPIPSSTGPVVEARSDFEQTNAWVLVHGAPPNTVLGVPAKLSLTVARGFRPGRRIRAPTYAYEIQQHEVTWREYASWLEISPGERGTFDPGLVAGEKALMPATAVSWRSAMSYCQHFGGALPTDEEWEYAARGSSLRLYPWGSQSIDFERTHVFRPSERLSTVMTNQQDMTPGTSADNIYDLLGNAREWTASLFRLDTSATSEEEAWVQTPDRTFRSIRGLPPNENVPRSIEIYSVAHREAMCSSGNCTSSAREQGAYIEMMESIGFRCARRARLPRRQEDL